MPRLVVFAPCQKAIISDQDQSLSLIALHESLDVTIAEGSEVPPDASIPIQWDIVAYWRAESTDGTKNFEQRVYLELPDHSLKADTLITFHLSDQTARNIVTVSGFPVGQPGACLLKLWVREADSEQDFQFVTDYLITVRHVKIEALSMTVEQETVEAETAPGG